MRVVEDTVPVRDLIETVQHAIKAANLSRTDVERDLRVGAVHLTINAVATRSAGGGIDFRIPVIGMAVKVGGKVSRKDTHTIEITLVPPDLKRPPELRDGDIESVFVDAIGTIRAAVATAAAGDDPFALTDGTVTIAFAVTREGTITLGVDGELGDELTHTLKLSLVPA
jgi:hypothetical protein